MTDDVATKIAALVRELGRMHAEIKARPQQSQADIMRATVDGATAYSAVTLALGVLVETHDDLARPLVDTVLLMSKLLGALHKDSTDSKLVSRGDVLRTLAVAADREDKLEGLLNGLRTAIGGAASTEPVPPTGKPGSN